MKTGAAAVTLRNHLSVLVVDDDERCLDTLSSMLKKFKYEVVAVNCAKDALCALRVKGEGAFELVIADVLMPDMNGFELQRAIAQEFENFPVVLMSDNDDDCAALKGAETGGAFFVRKPLSLNDVKGLWQFAAMKRRGHKRYAEKGEACAEKKKTKLSWTESLHNRFLEAIRSIGFDRAVPKKILEVMNVPGLTRDNVSSHLQKYRNFLKRASDPFQYLVDDTSSSSPLFITSSSPSPTSLMLNNFPYQQSLPNNLIYQSGIFGQPQSILADEGILINPSYNNNIITTPSNYVGYTISNLRNLTGNSTNAVMPNNVNDSFSQLPNVIGDYDQLYSYLPNVGNDHPMDQQPLNQGEPFTTELGDQDNILNQAMAQRNEGETFATTSNSYGNLIEPQDFATSPGQLINNTMPLQPVHEHDEDDEYLESLLANIWRDSNEGI